jgi:DHA1 family bicyclomycin/chloramphenicol resistance-like MFS transporter
MAGNFAVARLTVRLGIDRLIRWGIAFTLIGSSLSIALYVSLPGWEMVAIFVPQFVIGAGNGLLMPTAIAGAVSVRPQVAGTASGMTGFIQMTIGAAAAQLSALVIAGASDGVPMLLLMFSFGVATAAAVFLLLRR